MNFKTTFAGLAGAAALSAQMATAAPHKNPEAEMMQMQQMQGMSGGFQGMGVQQQNTIIDPDMQPLIGNADVNIEINVDFENGAIVTDSVDVNVTNIACTEIEPLFEMLDAMDQYENSRMGIERSAEEQELVDSIRQLFQDQVFDYSETVTPETAKQLLEAQGLVGIQLPTDFPLESRVSIHLECEGYEAPAPTFTPVEPN